MSDEKQNLETTGGQSSVWSRRAQAAWLFVFMPFGLFSLWDWRLGLSGIWGYAIAAGCTAFYALMVLDFFRSAS